MCRLNYIRNFVLGITVVLSSAAQADPQPWSTNVRPYVLFYEGAIDGDASTIEKSINEVFKEVDKSKVTSEIFQQNPPGSNIYTIEAFLEPNSIETVGYVRDFVNSHKEFSVGNVKLKFRPAIQLGEFFSMSGFGPDNSGKKEIKWGEIARTRQFSNIGEYTTNIVNLGMSLSQGDEREIRKAIPSVVSPTDAYIFLSWLKGIEPSSRKLSRFTFESHSFFVMEDGTYINRALSWSVNRRLTAQPQSGSVAKLVKRGFQPMLPMPRQAQ